MTATREVHRLNATATARDEEADHGHVIDRDVDADHAVVLGRREIGDETLPKNANEIAKIRKRNANGNAKDWRTLNGSI